MRWTPCAAQEEVSQMDVVYERCCGLDIHKRTIVACVIVPGAGGKPSTQIRTLGTMTEEVVQLADGLTPHHVTQVAMESTGVYGKPIWNLVEAMTS
jgi:transposase